MHVRNNKGIVITSFDMMFVFSVKIGLEDGGRASEVYDSRRTLVGLGPGAGRVVVSPASSTVNLQVTHNHSVDG